MPTFASPVHTNRGSGLDGTGPPGLRNSLLRLGLALFLVIGQGLARRGILRVQAQGAVQPAQAIFPVAAIFTWCVLAYLCIDFGFWHKLFNVRPE